MILTVIPSDKSVYKDGIFQKDLIWSGTPENVHALQWDDNSGWIEYTNGAPNDYINQLPDWALNAEKAWEDANNAPPPAPVPPTAEENKMTAVGLLQMTDWVNQPDVIDVNNSPHLLNKDEFDAYRVQVRAIAVNPVAGYIDFPTMPSSVWSD